MTKKLLAIVGVVFIAGLVITHGYQKDRHAIEQKGISVIIPIESPAPVVPKDFSNAPIDISALPSKEPTVVPMQAEPAGDNIIPSQDPVQEIAIKAPKIAPGYKRISLHRIDSSGIYWLPDNAKAKAVTLDGNFISDYAITENGNLDIFRAKPDSIVTATIY